MESYYIYCSNNLAYNALINNSIMSKSVTQADFQENTVSFLSNDYIFISRKRLSDEVRYMNASDIYYPIALEIADDGNSSAIPARLVTIDNEGALEIASEESTLDRCCEVENCIGAFVFGEIPITYLSGIIFDNEEEKLKFKKSSLDLWFPEDLYRLWDKEEIDERVTGEVLSGISHTIADFLTEEEVVEGRKLVLARIRTKAASYYALEATEGWNIGSVRTNLDGTMIRYLDQSDGLLSKGFEKIITDIKDYDGAPFAEIMGMWDPVLDVNTETVVFETDTIVPVAVDNNDIIDIKAEDTEIEKTETEDAGEVKNEANNDVTEDDIKVEVTGTENDKTTSTFVGDINKALFYIIIKSLMDKTSVRERISDERFNEIGQMCLDAVCDSRKKEMISALHILERYLKSNMDPDEALASMGEFDVLRSFMLFFDQQENSDFMRRACTKLDQNERRYAYIMFGVLNGMAEVERDRKSNRCLEYRLEELVCSHFRGAHLINALIPIEKCRFATEAVKDKKRKNQIYGILPSVNVWYDCKSSLKRLLDASDKQLEAVYKLMVKSLKDDPIPEQDVYALKTPIVISVSVAGDELQRFEITHKKDAKDYGKKIERLAKSEKEVFIADGFKKYLADEKMYARFYKKHADDIQQYCRKG